MQIAFLTPEYPHPKTGTSGGIGTSIKNLAQGLLAQDCYVRVLVYGQKKEEVFEDNGIAVQRIKNVKFKGLSWWLTRKKLERIINELYAGKEIDLVEAPDWTGITSFIKPKKCPIVIRLHGSDTYFCTLDNRPVKWKNKFHERRALQKAHGLLSVSQFTADLTNEVFGLQEEFTIIPNCIDVDVFNRYSNNIGVLPAGVSRILYLGSLIRKKGLLELPFIFNEVILKDPKVQLILVGKDVPDISSGCASTWMVMKELFTDEALKNVQYLGSVDYDEVTEHINSSTICVFPSFAEALPVSWLEVMAMQKPIVASNIGWATELISDEVEGFLVNPKNHKVFAQRILQLLESPDLQKSFGTKSRKKVEDTFSTEVVAKQSLLFYQRFNRSK